MRRKISLYFFAALVSQYLVAGEETLQDYIQLALDRNLALQQKEFSLKQSIEALTEARGMFLPSVSINARYTRAGGGREIAIPVGDLMNPVYKTLNQILSQSGQPAMFPESIPNVSEPFLREKEHETKIRIVQPLFQPGIVYHYKINRELKDIEQAARDIYTRALICDVKKAYFNQLKTLQIVHLLDETESLLQENVRVSQSLFDNGKITRAAVYRAEAELHQFHQQQADAEKAREMSLAYFNFLLNRPLDMPVAVMNPEDIVQQQESGDGDAEQTALSNREELDQLKKSIHIMEDQISLSKSRFLPDITAVFDYGYQGETYDFGPENDYWMGNLVANWTLFNGFRNKSKLDQAQLQKRIAQNRLETVRLQIKMQVREALLNIDVSRKQIESSRAGEKAAAKSFDMIEREYREGIISHVEFLDARRRLTEANVNAIVAQYDFIIRQAEFEQVTGTYPMTTTEED